MQMANLGIMERARKLLNGAGGRAGKQEVKNGPAAGASNSKNTKETPRSIPLPIWMETEARVTECHRRPSSGRKLPLQVSKDPGNVIVFFSYYAHAQLYYDHFKSPVVRDRGEAFSVYYNALNPRQNTRSPSRFVNRHPLSDTTILGFILVSILLLSVASG
jgi:hypothetical protein